MSGGWVITTMVKLDAQNAEGIDFVFAETENTVVKNAIGVLKKTNIKNLNGKLNPKSKR